MHWTWKEGMREGGVSTLLRSRRIHPRGAKSVVVVGGVGGSLIMACSVQDLQRISPSALSVT